MNTNIKHLGIIMDGNGRWAQKRGRDRFWGHLRGAKVAQNIIEECSRSGVEVLTLFAFSTENWFRPKEEITFLMQLLKRQLAKEREKLIKNRIRFQVIGDKSRLPDFALEEVEKTIEMTKDCEGMTLVFALSYGARAEILNACKTISERVHRGDFTLDDVDENLFSRFLQTGGWSDPDVILRTSGESRLSNFMLWQAAYSEIFVSQTLWPDFTTTELHSVFEQFNHRERRFGRVCKTASNEYSKEPQATPPN